MLVGIAARRGVALERDRSRGEVAIVEIDHFRRKVPHFGSPEPAHVASNIGR